MDPALVWPTKKPPALVVFCNTAPTPRVVVRPVALPKTTVNTPFLGLIEPVNEFGGEVSAILTSAFLVLTCTSKESWGGSWFAPEMFSCPFGIAMAATPGGGLVQGDLNT